MFHVLIITSILGTYRAEKQKRQEWGAVIHDTDFFLIEMLQVTLLQLIRTSTDIFKNFQKWYKIILSVKCHSQVTEKLFFMQHRNNFHRGVSGTVYFAIILSGATAKGISLYQLCLSLSQILHSGPQMLWTSAGRIKHILSPQLQHLNFQTSCPRSVQHSIKAGQRSGEGDGLFKRNQVSVREGEEKGAGGK